MRTPGNRRRPSVVAAVSALLALCAALGAGQVYQGNAATIRPGEIPDGLFAASNAFAEGSEITVRHLDTGALVEVEVVARANGGVVLLLLAPRAASALGIDEGEIVRVDAQLTSVAVDPGAQAADPSASDDPDIDPAAGLPRSLADYLASLPPIESADAADGTAVDPADGTSESDGTTDATDAAVPSVDPNAPPVLSGVPDAPTEPSLDAASALASADLDRPDQPGRPADDSAAHTASTPPADAQVAATEAADVAPPPLTLLGVDAVPQLPDSPDRSIAAAPAQPQPPRSQIVDAVPTADNESLATSPPELPADDELVALLAVPEPTRESVSRAEPTAELPVSLTRLVLVEPTEPRPPAARADSPPPLAEGEALAVVAPAPAAPDRTDPTEVELADAPTLPRAQGVATVLTQPELAHAEVNDPPFEDLVDPPLTITLLPLEEPAVAAAAALVEAGTVEADAVGTATVESSDPDDQVGPRLAQVVVSDGAIEPTDQVASESPIGVAAAGALGPPPPVDGQVYLLQLGAFASQSGAQNVALRVPRSFAPAVVGSEGDRRIFKVLIGPLNRDESGTLLYRFRATGFPDAFLIPFPGDELARGTR